MTGQDELLEIPGNHLVGTETLQLNASESPKEEG